MRNKLCPHFSILFKKYKKNVERLFEQLTIWLLSVFNFRLTTSTENTTQVS